LVTQPHRLGRFRSPTSMAVSVLQSG
jgi:hypothetical protein